MPAVAFKDLCIDVTAGEGRPAAVAAFWSAALGQRVVAHDDGDFHLAAPDGGPPERTVWINAVPEPPTGKTRVHLDTLLADGDPAPLVAAGGTIEREPGGDIEWHVLQDPDGVALCVFGPRPAAPTEPTLVDSGLFEPGAFALVVDAADPARIALWWADLTGGTVRHPEDPHGSEGSYVWIEGAAGFPWRYWVFHAVPEPKTTKNRVHWDVSLADATIADLVADGATVLRERDDQISWSVMADPEGNEFCAFAAR